MNKATRIVATSIFLLAPIYAFAQRAEPFHPEWLATDVANLAYLAQLPKVDRPQLSVLESALTSTGTNIVNLPNLRGDRGNGFREISFHGAGRGGYTSMSVTAIAFKDEIIRYRVEVSGSEDSWWMIRGDIIAGWKRNTELSFAESNRGIYYEREFPDVMAKYQRTVAAEFRELGSVSVPLSLKSSYDLLTSPYKNLVVGFGGCGYGGSTPAGKEAIDALVSAHRIDLIENVLKGPNAGGRIYAAVALLEFKKGGDAISAEALTVIRKIEQSSTPIDVCSGCIGSQATAKEIIGDKVVP